MKTKITKQTCQADILLTPIDVGFDVRLHNMAVEIPVDATTVVYEDKGEIWYAKGTRDEIIEIIKDAGYIVA